MSVFILSIIPSVAPQLVHAQKTAAAQRYVLVPADSLLYVQVFRDEDALASGWSHNHVIRAEGWQGHFVYDVQTPDACSLDISIPVQQLAVDEPWLRQKVGYTESLDDSDRKKIRNNMLDDDQLNGETYPTIRILGSKCDVTSPDTIRIHLKMIVHGHSKAFTTPVKLRSKSDRLVIDGSFVLTHADFGFKPYSAFFGAVRNQDELKFVAHVVGQKHPQMPAGR